MYTRVLLMGALCSILLLARGQSYPQALADVLQRNQLVGMSVVSYCRGQVMDSQHFGLADVARSVPVNENTLYRVASISKSITALAVMRLFETGKFGLHDDVSKHLGFVLRNPRFPQRPITVAQLLAHTSSLADGDAYHQFLAEAYALRPVPNLEQLLSPTGKYYGASIWREQQSGNFEYANINYVVLGTLVEKWSGQRFDHFVRDWLFAPLDMEAAFLPSELRHPEHLAVLYRQGTAQADNYGGAAPPSPQLNDYVPGTNASVFGPQGGLRIRPADLARLLQITLDYGRVGKQRLLDSTTVALMRQTHWLYNGANGNNYHGLFNSWGLGLHLITGQAKGDRIWQQTRWVGHAGEAYGLISDWYALPEAQFGLVFVTNGYSRQQGYSDGEYSSFYLPEEAVFRTVMQHKYAECVLSNPLAVPQTSGAVQLRYAAREHALYLSRWAGGQLAVFDSLGRIVLDTPLAGDTWALPPMPVGLYRLLLNEKGRVAELTILVEPR